MSGGTKMVTGRTKAKWHSAKETLKVKVVAVD